MQDNDKFDYKGLVADNKSRNERLKFWDNELCRKKPHIFDIVIAVRWLTSPSLQFVLMRCLKLAWW